MPQRSTKRRGRLSLTSLIDVIFLLLLFFMLSSTFSKFGDIELTVAGGSARTDFNDTALVFARLTADGLKINGQTTTLDALPTAIDPLRRNGDVRLLLSIGQDAQAQGLVDTLQVFNTLPDVKFAVLE
ncbi:MULTISPECIES: biopolymer transporter ExbD [Pacificibacter]|uniref:biopolymer transporter ExbD n=1 Tax=Pacificibacter TaxID=1042323 RepID=UPI001C087196|nr:MULTISPECIES: biopolymer transporter ExbD [Pacificibacter]MBU2937776.1 biopolymer transporter ExbD [Pacificibacter marinus]MDO6616037.1 biopolymer transporter ExbD [Pacificibacter sp. 1_MG-2023]